MAKNYLLCTSRGSSRNGSKQGLFNDELMAEDNLLDNPLLKTLHKSGQKLDLLIDQLEKMHILKGRPMGATAYFLAGYVDITYMDLDKNYSIYNSVTGYSWQGRYEEVHFLDNVEEAVAKATVRYQEADQRVRRLGIRPCFATVPPSVLADWNNFRLSSGRTAFLLHEPHYHDMQSLLNRSCQGINSIIVSINRSNGMATPFIAGTIMDTKSNKMGHKLEPRVFRRKYFDGVHATDTTLKEWAKVMAKAININDKKRVGALPWLSRDFSQSHHPSDDSDSSDEVPS